MTNDAHGGRPTLIEIAPYAFGMLLLALGGIQNPRAVDRGLVLAFALVIAGMGVLVLGWLWRSGRAVHLPKSLLPWVIASGVATVVSVAVAPDLVQLIPRTVTYVGLVLVATAAYGINRGQVWSLTRWLVPVVACSGLFVVVAFVHMASFPPSQQPAHVVGFVHVRQMGAVAYIVAATLMGLSLIHRRFRVPFLFGTTFTLFIVESSGSRGATLAWILFVGLVVVMHQRGNRAPVIIEAAIALVVSSSAVITLNATRVWQSQSIFVRAADAAHGGVSDLSSGRLDAWRTSLAQIFRAPLFGRGPDAFANIFPTYGIAHPHSVVLELLLEFGFVGVLIMVCVALRALALQGGVRRWWAACRRTTAGQVLTGLVVSHLTLAMIDGPLYWLFPATLFAVLFGLWCAVVADSSNGREAEGPARDVGVRS